MKRPLFFFFAFLSIFQTALIRSAFCEVSPGMLWKTRGLEAIEKLKGLDKNTSDPKTQLEIMLETSFAQHATDPEFEHEIGNGLDFYKIILQKSQGDFFILNYVYDKKEQPDSTNGKPIHKALPLFFALKNAC